MVFLGHFESVSGQNGSFEVVFGSESDNDDIPKPFSAHFLDFLFVAKPSFTRI